MLKRACDRTDGRQSTRAVYKRLKRREMQMWVALDGQELLAAFASEIHRCPTGLPVFCIVLAGGSGMRRWAAAAIRTAKAFAREKGCARVDIHGRRGWLRVFRQQGFRELHTTIEMRV